MLSYVKSCYSHKEEPFFEYSRIWCKIVNGMHKKPLRENIFYKGKRPIRCDWLRPYIYTSNLAYHSEVEFHYIKRGEGFYFIQNRRYPFSKNNIVAIKSGEIHKCIRQSSYVEKGSLYFPLSFLKNARLKKIVKECPHVAKMTEKEAMLAEIIFKSISEETGGGKPFWEELVHSQTEQFLFLLKRASLRKTKKVISNPVVEGLIAYLDSNFARDVSIPEIAEGFSLSPSRISHIFKEETGLGLKHYMFQKRIIEAKKLLEENHSMKVTAISAKVGFGDFALFNSTFKKATGRTPSYYRRFSRRGGK